MYSPYGASLVDADLVRPEGEPGNDRFFEMFPLIGLVRCLAPESMEILDSGKDSGTAIVRFIGTDGGIPLIDSVLATKKLQVEVTVDFLLSFPVTTPRPSPEDSSMISHERTSV